MNAKATAFSLWLACVILAAQAQAYNAHGSVDARATANAHGAVVRANLRQTQPSACLTRPKAEAEAGSLAQKSAQVYCRSEGYGWRASTVTGYGQLDCHPCGGGGFSCGHAGVALECRKAGPKLAGLVGWFTAAR